MSPPSNKRQADRPTAASVPSPPSSTSLTASTPSKTPVLQPSPTQNSIPQANQSSSGHVFRMPQSPHSAASEQQGSVKAAKVAIPRLKKTNEDASSTQRAAGRHRVNHACEPCRQRKTKCSGERPQCKHCQDFKINCFYADGKRDRAKKYASTISARLELTSDRQFGSMAEKMVDFERLLKDLMLRVDDQDAANIKGLLEQVDIPPGTVGNEAYISQDVQAETDDNTPEFASPNSVGPEGVANDSDGESDVSGTVGSTGALDMTLEDFASNERSRATGFMGKNSEVTWMQRLRQENKYGSSSSHDLDGEPRWERKEKSVNDLLNNDEISAHLPDEDEEFTVSDSSYHCDDFAMPSLDHVDPYEFPPNPSAKQLYDTYITRVHPTFPIIGKTTFTSQFHRFMEGNVPGGKWLAILNLIFAISAKYSHLVQADWRGDDRDHLIYFTRARLLSMNSETIFQHSDLQQIQVGGLMSLYLLCTSQVNRSWTILGIAVRAATGLGLNMRNESLKTQDGLKEIRYRVWWSLYVLEHLLGNMTGRATSISDDYCTTPLPLPYEEADFHTPGAKTLLRTEVQRDDRNPSTCPLSSSAAGSTPASDRSRSASAKLENSKSPSAPSFPGLSWTRNVPPNASLYFLEYVQLARLTQEILKKLYTPFAVHTNWSKVQKTIAELDTDLESWYRSLPASFDFKKKTRNRDFHEFRYNLGFFFYSTQMKINRPCLCRLDRKIPNQSAMSKEFNRDAASKCVDAAQEMLSLIPDEPNAIGLNSVGPWWNILHYLVQATTVMMLELSFRATHMPGATEELITASKKAVRWLHQMAEENVSARRAWQFCDRMLRETVPKVGGDVTDLSPAPPGSVSSNAPSHHSNQPYHSQVHNANHHQAQYAIADPPNMFQSMPDYNTYTIFDQYMPYDNLEASMDGHNYQPTSAEMEFMNNTYHEQQNYNMDHDFSPATRPN